MPSGAFYLKEKAMTRNSKKMALGIAAAIAAVPALLWAFSNFVQVQDLAGYRYIRSNGIPDHSTGQFPNAHNPNTISPQEYTFRVPENPRLTGSDHDYGHNLFGVALNGVPFDPGTAEFWDDDPGSGWNYEALSGKINLGIDQNHAHVQPNGAYHYHGVPMGFLLQTKKTAAGSLIGYAADGFPVYYQSGKRPSYRVKTGARPSGPGGNYDGSFVQDYEYVPGSGDLDSCNGEKTKEEPGYRYYLTDQFPFVPRCLKGTPDPSFVKKEPHQHGGKRREGGRRGAGAEGGNPPRPPREAVEACEGSGSGNTCSFQSPRGRITGTCRNLQNLLACVPERR